MPLRFYNTLSQQAEEFRPARDNTVRMYTCGPTVYDFAHIGNFRTFTFVDLLRRWLRASGFQLDHVMNVTDVDDKIIRNATAQHKSLEEYTGIYTKAFLEDCAALRLERPERLVPATAHIDDMAEAIERLTAEGHTYRSDGSVYFKHRHISRVRQTFAQRFQRQHRRRSRGCGRVRKERRTRFRSVEGAQGRREVLGHQDRSGPSGLAH